MCIDYKDLKKACPKNTFSLPNINQMIYATTGHKLMSFLDVYSRYNQIRIHLEDQEKTSFTINFSTYYYTSLPFGSMNVRVTYQILVTQISKCQTGKTLEIYIDDMLFKSLSAGSHLTHFQGTFDILRKYNMKLNSKKYAFGVGSNKFLDFLLSQRGIEVNLDKIKAIEYISDQLTSVK